MSIIQGHLIPASGAPPALGAYETEKEVTQSPRLGWRFDGGFTEELGIVASTDLSTSGSPTADATKVINGSDGTSVDYNGTTQYAYNDGALVTELVSHTQGSIELSINTDSIAADRCPFSIGLSSANTTDCFISIASNGAILFGIRRDSSNRLLQTTGASVIAINTDYHIIITGNGTAWDCQVNGSDKAMTDFVQNGAGAETWWLDELSGVDQVTIGMLRRSTNAQFWDGQIDNVYIHNTAMTSGEKADAYTAWLDA